MMLVTLGIAYLGLIVTYKTPDNFTKIFFDKIPSGIIIFITIFFIFILFFFRFYSYISLIIFFVVLKILTAKFGLLRTQIEAYTKDLKTVADHYKNNLPEALFNKYVFNTLLFQAFVWPFFHEIFF